MKVKLIIKEIYEQVQVQICNNEVTEEVKELYRLIDQTVNKNIQGYDGEEIFMIPISSIVHIFTQNLKVYISTKNGCYRSTKRLYELEQELDETLFIRVSNSEIVNRNRIKKLDTSITGTIKLYLDFNQVAYVSRRYVPKIKKAFGI